MEKIETGWVLVDSNVLIDVLHNDPVWSEWSGTQLARVMREGKVAINPVIYAEVSAYYQTAREADSALNAAMFSRLPLPWEAAFLAGQAFREYRLRGGGKTNTLPDFFIGAHAQVGNLSLLTRDVRRYQSYFPEVRLITPD